MDSQLNSLSKALIPLRAADNRKVLGCREPAGSSVPLAFCSNRWRNHWLLSKHYEGKFRSDARVVLLWLGEDPLSRGVSGW